MVMVRWDRNVYGGLTGECYGGGKGMRGKRMDIHRGGQQNEVHKHCLQGANGNIMEG
jgi:hypothetical protein